MALSHTAIFLYLLILALRSLKAGAALDEFSPPHFLNPCLVHRRLHLSSTEAELLNVSGLLYANPSGVVALSGYIRHPPRQEGVIFSAISLRSLFR